MCDDAGKRVCYSHPWPSDSSCCNVCRVCYAHLPARRLAHCKDSFSTLSSFFWKVSHARWAFNTYLIFEVGLGMWQWKIQCKRSFVLQKALVTQWYVECFEREAQTSVRPEYRHQWKQSPGKFKSGMTSEDDCPSQQASARKDRWIPLLSSSFLEDVL